MSVSETKTDKRSAPPPIVTSNKALKLAEQWVDNMTKVADDEATEVDTVGRPSRLGLGAKVARQTRVANVSDPLERKLLAKLGAGKRKYAKVAEESTSRDDSDDDETKNLDSRTSAFAKKRPAATHVLPSRVLKKPK